MEDTQMPHSPGLWELLVRETHRNPHNCELRLAGQDTCKQLLEVEVEWHLVGEAAFAPAEWAEKEGRAAQAREGGVSTRKGVESGKGQLCLGSSKKKSWNRPVDIR